MAKYIDKRTIINKNRPISDFGFLVVPIYIRNVSEEFVLERRKWIDNNIIGEWTAFNFALPRCGRSYCFKNEEDKVKFMLRWL